MDFKSKYLELKDRLEYHMDRYYNQDDPEISDFEYDVLMQEYKSLEKEHPELITNDSPTQKVGGKVKREAGVKVEHNVPMLSIEDVFTKVDIIKWVDDVRNLHPDVKFSVEQKIDGLSVNFRYQNGELKLAETRGDGFKGEDVTLNSFYIGGVKKKIDVSYDLEIRGEVYMSHEDFEKINERQELLGKKIFANPRNCAAGTLRQLDPEITRDRGLKLFIFNIQDGPSELMQNHTVGLEILSALSIPVVPHKLCVDTKEILAEIDAIDESRGDYGYDIDGAVIKIEQVDYRADFPAGSKNSAGHIAYKYPPEEKEAVIKDIVLAVGRTGRISPTAVFTAPDSDKPIRLCGTNVSRATLHNQDFINELGVGIGDTVLVYKSGEIIPKIKTVIKHVGETYKIPNTCPDCGHQVVRELDTADIKCINPFCPSQLIRTIAYFSGRDAMDIKNFGEKYVEALIQEGYIHDYSDIYNLKDFRNELVHKGVMGKDKNTDKILKSIEDSKNNDPVKLLTGLGIQNVGKASAKEIMRTYKSIMDLSKATVADLVSIQDIGEITAQSIVDFFKTPENEKIIEKLQIAGVNMVNKIIEGATSKLENKTFCITGTLNMGRKQVEDLIGLNGGKVIGLSKKLDYLIAGEAAGSKLEKAKLLGITIISENELMDMIKL